jgi:transcriptional regulator
MKTIEETYREKLKILIHEFGSQAALARQIDKSPAQINQWLHGTTGASGKPRSFKAETARLIERKTGKPAGWFDQPASGTTTLITSKEKTDTTTLNLYDVAGSCGHGRINSEFPDLLRSLEIPNSALKELLGTTNLHCVQLCPPDGDSMEPTIPRRSITLIKTDISEFQNSGVYLITFQGYTYIKRLALGKGGTIFVTSDNPVYSKTDFEITPNEYDQLTVHGKFWKALPLDFLDI